ncbi:MAG: YfcE family phosphodiesterase, partial [Gammaproteobacteria bacterium]|nr:YfcE family phosphodiesterase [Gammaproteobacteria bacterium]
MRIGVVSDTHNNLPNVRKIVSLFNQLEIDKVVHTGDITQAKTLEVFAQLQVPLHGVYGNNDLERDSLGAAVLRHGFEFVDPPFVVEWHGRRIQVVHDPRDLGVLDLSETHLALHGHT